MTFKAVRVGLIVLAMCAASVSSGHKGAAGEDIVSRLVPAPRAGEVPRLAHGSPPPQGSEWVMVSATACNRSFAEELELDPTAAIDYTGRTPPDVLHDVAMFGAKWRMAAVRAGSIVATTEWCDSPAPEAPPAMAGASAGRTVTCGCR